MIEQILTRSGLYYDVIGLIGEYIHGDKSYWKMYFHSTLNVIRNQKTKENIIQYDELRKRFSDFLLLQGEYDIYQPPQNQIAKSIHMRGKSCSVHEFIAVQPIIESMFYNKYVISMQKQLRRHTWMNDSSEQKVLQPYCENSVYKFGNHYSVNRIMHNRWVGSVMQQDNMTLLLHELLRWHESKEKMLKLEKRKKQFFQLNAVFSTHQYVYRVVEIDDDKLRLKDNYEEYKYCYYMHDDDGCVYIFPDKSWRYKYYTDNTVEKIW